MQSVNSGSGLQNLGNTCFFNATLQAVLHAPQFAILLEKQSHTSQCSKKNGWCIFCEVQKVYTGTRQNRIYSPSNMLQNLNKVFKKFKLGRQEDSHEFLRYLIQGMQDSQTGKLPKDQREQNEKKIKKTNIFEVFGGVMRTVVECLSCSHKSITNQRYYDFNIECQRANSLPEGIASYFAVDKLQGANKYLCEHCKTRSNARKRFQLDTMPLVATFQLKRFTNSMRKIGKFVHYPYQIDLGKYLEKPKKEVMRLFAVVVHLGGSSFSGHYYAFVRVGTTWFKMDDSYVSKCSLETALNQQAYILFYQREKVHQKQEKAEQTIKVVEPLKEKEKEQKKVQQNSKSKDKHQVTLQKKKEDKMVPENQSLKIFLNGNLHKNGRQNSPRQKSARQKSSKQKQNGQVKKDNRQKNEKEKNKEIPKKQENKEIPEKQENNEIPEPIFDQIETKLVNKLSQAQVFKTLEDKKDIVTNTISKVVKQIIQEVSPTKKKEHQINSQPPQKNQEENGLVLPGLSRKKSKEQMQSEIPYADLIMQTFQKILDMSSKMPRNKPRNFSQRTIYNLRKYETKMQKKRKIG